MSSKLYYFKTEEAKIPFGQFFYFLCRTTLILLALFLSAALSSPSFAAKSDSKSSEKTKKSDKKKYSPADLMLQDAQKKLGIWEGEKDSDKKKSETAGEEKSKTEKKSEKEKFPPESDKPSIVTDDNKISFTWTLLKTLLVLGILSFILFYGLRFLAKKKGFQPKGGNLIDVLAQVPILPNRQIHVVAIADSVLILGVTDSNITLLSKIEDQYTIDKLKLHSSQSSLDKKQSFLQLLYKNIKNISPNFSPTDLKLKASKDKTPESEEAEGNIQDLLKKQREKLNNLKNL